MLWLWLWGTTRYICCRRWLDEDSLLSLSLVRLCTSGLSLLCSLLPIHHCLGCIPLRRSPILLNQLLRRIIPRRPLQLLNRLIPFLPQFLKITRIPPNPVLIPARHRPSHTPQHDRSTRNNRVFKGTPFSPARHEDEDEDRKDIREAAVECPAYFEFAGSLAEDVVFGGGALDFGCEGAEGAFEGGGGVVVALFMPMLDLGKI